MLLFFIGISIVFIPFSFLSFIKSVYYRQKLADSAVKILSSKKRFSSYILNIALAVFAFHRLYNYGVYIQADDTARAKNDLCWGILALIYLIYSVVILLNSKYVYITNRMLLFPDCVRKAEDYQYRLTENILELRPVKPPKKLETYIIEENVESLEEILTENYQMIED